MLMQPKKRASTACGEMADRSKKGSDVPRATPRVLLLHYLPALSRRRYHAVVICRGWGATTSIPNASIARAASSGVLGASSNMRSKPPGVVITRKRADDDSMVNVCGIPRGYDTNAPAVPEY